MSEVQKLIGQILKQMELVSESQLQEALAIQIEKGGVIGQILVRLGYIANDELLLALAVQMGAEVIDFTDGDAGATLRMQEEQVEFLSPHPSWPLDDLTGSAAVTRLLNLILCTVLKAQASALHFHLWNGQCQVRYRVDGVLYDMVSPPLHLALPLLARIRYLTGYPEHRSATVALAGRQYRVEPVEDGESMILMFSPAG